MAKIIWDVRILATTLGYVFLQKMAKNMRGAEDATVEVGELGRGVQPNYQVRFPNGVVNLYRGSTHRPFAKPEPFEEQNISRKFSLREIVESIEIAKSEGFP
ncbi:hypothetical protein [Pseudomonas japonica]|uniref:hypothetical protein n=1 Tax=Pseudomonas japonica TaxID=256466 RepID=UPI0015E48F55|nr:hypothetical protein [Pseudomonas japonica]MBA1245928.1 hypothetical protein [Pseudomonas japonica]